MLTLQICILKKLYELKKTYQMIFFIGQNHCSKRVKLYKSKTGNTQIVLRNLHTEWNKVLFIFKIQISDQKETNRTVYKKKHVYRERINLHFNPLWKKVYNELNLYHIVEEWCIFSDVLIVILLSLNPVVIALIHCRRDMSITHLKLC